MAFNFGNGTGITIGSGLANMPNGVSVSVQKENDKPAHITVKRGNDKWNIIGDDPESLKKLPEDLRPFVERMVHSGGGMNIQMPKFRTAISAARLGQRPDARAAWNAWSNGSKKCRSDSTARINQRRQANDQPESNK